MRVASLAATLVLLSSVLVLTQDGQQGGSPAAPTAPTSGTPGGTAPSQRSRTDQKPATGTAILRGRVVRADTGQPLRRVHIRTYTSEPYATVTDDQGRYELAKLPAGTYHISAAKGGFVGMQYGQRRTSGPGRPFTLADGQVIEKIDFAMTPGGIITGRVVDEAGEPVIGASLQTIRMATARRRGPQSSPNYGGGTDDRGEYRIFGLPPGDYYVVANANLPEDVLGGQLTYAKTYYPGTSSRADAQRITLRGGEETSGVNFTLTSARTASISGMVRNSDGTQVSLAMISLFEKSDDGDPAGMSASLSRPDGSFVIPNVEPGTYIVDVRSITRPEVESQPVEVTVSNRDVTGLILEIGRGTTARGRIRFDTNAPPRDVRPEMMRVFAIAAAPQDVSHFSSNGMPPPTRDDWTFELTGLTGRRLLRAEFFLNQDWFLKSVSLDGMDVTDTPIDFRNGDVDGIEVVLTQRVIEVAGGVTDDRGLKVMDGTVLVFSTDREKWGPRTRFTRQSRLDQDGRFRLRGLPPGNYVIVAVDDLEAGDETDPEILQQLLPKGTRVTLGEGEMRTIDLKITEF